MTPAQGPPFFLLSFFIIAVTAADENDDMAAADRGVTRPLHYFWPVTLPLSPLPPLRSSEVREVT